MRHLPALIKDLALILGSAGVITYTEVFAAEKENVKLEKIVGDRRKIHQLYLRQVVF